MITGTPEIPFTPEQLIVLPWEVTDTTGYDQLQETATQLGLRLPDKPKAIRGGGILNLPAGATGVRRQEGKSLEEFLSEDRSIGIFPASEGDTSEFNRLIFLLNNPEGKKHFNANLLAWKDSYAPFLEESWKTEGKTSSCIVPQALQTFQLPDGRVAIVTEYNHNFESLGLGEPDLAVHQLDATKLPLTEIPRLLEALDSCAAPSEEFINWQRQSGKTVPDSWLKEGNANCALRGHEWWYNPERDSKGITKPDKWGDRLEELTNVVYADDGVKRLYLKTFGKEEFPVLLEKMIKNNLPLYLFQDGKKEKEVNGQLVKKDDKLLGETVVTHGTLYPDQIFRKLDSITGEVNYLFTGGDRSQLYGLRGQMIDWLVASAASDKRLQYAMVQEFKNIQKEKGRDVEKEMRGLAMHVMYRAIKEANWFASQNKWKEATNLVSLTRAILKGHGIWENVNTKLEAVSREVETAQFHLSYDAATSFRQKLAISEPDPGIPVIGRFKDALNLEEKKASGALLADILINYADYLVRRGQESDNAQQVLTEIFALRETDKEYPNTIIIKLFEQIAKRIGCPRIELDWDIFGSQDFTIKSESVYKVYRKLFSDETRFQDREINYLISIFFGRLGLSNQQADPLDFLTGVVSADYAVRLVENHIRTIATRRDIIRDLLTMEKDESPNQAFSRIVNFIINTRSQGREITSDSVIQAWREMSGGSGVGYHSEQDRPIPER